MVGLLATLEGELMTGEDALPDRCRSGLQEKPGEGAAWLASFLVASATSGPSALVFQHRRRCANGVGGVVHDHPPYRPGDLLPVG